MPEYQIPISNIADWNSLDAFTQGYIEAMFFTENSPAWSKSDIESNPQQWENALNDGSQIIQSATVLPEADCLTMQRNIWEGATSNLENGMPLIDAACVFELPMGE